jgi:D-alanyl-D-alanine endopeptidase (penicillin-binding protein 7)
VIALSIAVGLPRKFALAFVTGVSMALTICSLPAQASTTSHSATGQSTTVVKKKVSIKKRSTQVRKVSRARSTSTARVYKTHRRIRASRPRAVPLSMGQSAYGSLALASHAALVVDQDSGETLVTKNSDIEMPIASLTKLMTALVVLDAKLPMDETLEISSEDIDRERNTHSRLTVGTELTRSEMLLLALMSSENRAAMSLSRNYPGGRKAFIAQMNVKAKSLGMNSTHFADPAGLSNESMSTAHDLQFLVKAAYAQPLIRRDSTQEDHEVLVGRRMLTFINSNRLVRGGGDWDIGMQKTGFTNEAGRCLVMQVNLQGRRLAMIFLDSFGKLTRYADALRVRQHLELNDKHMEMLRANTGANGAAAAAVQQERL